MTGLAAAFWLALGALLAAGLIAAVRWRRSRGRPFAIGLSVASLVYVVFALMAGDGAAVRTEVVGFVAFSVAALAGWRRWTPLLAVGWAAHVVWDVGLHLMTPVAYVGAWYPTTCVSFDLVLAAYLAVGPDPGGSARGASPPEVVTRRGWR